MHRNTIITLSCIVKVLFLENGLVETLQTKYIPINCLPDPCVTTSPAHHHTVLQRIQLTLKKIDALTRSWTSCWAVIAVVLFSYLKKKIYLFYFILFFFLDPMQT